MARRKPAITLQQMCEKLVEACSDRYEAANKSGCTYTSFSNYLRGARNNPSPLQAPGLIKAFVKYIQPRISKEIAELAIDIGTIRKGSVLYNLSCDWLGHLYQSSVKEDSVTEVAVFARGESMTATITDMSKLLPSSDEKIQRLHRFASHHE